MEAARAGELERVESWLRETGALLARHFAAGVAAQEKSDGSLVTRADREANDLLARRIGEAYPGEVSWLEESGRSAAQGTVWVVDPLDGTTNFVHRMPYYAVSIARVEVRGDRYRPVLGGVFAPALDLCVVGAVGSGVRVNGAPSRVQRPEMLKTAYLATGLYYFDERTSHRLDAELARYAAVARRCQRVRRHGASALDLALVAAGIHHGFWQYGLSAWDVAAGAGLIQAAGGCVKSYPGGGAPLADFSCSGDEGIVAGEVGLVDELRGLLEKTE